MAHEGKYILPDVIVPNEFYELENAKFSTSRGHLIWARDLVSELPRDYARFYLCLTSPEHNRSNFSRGALNQILNERLISSWNSLVQAYNGQHWDPGLDDAAEATDKVIAVMRERLALTCRLETFSQSRLADWILHHIGRLLDLISEGNAVNLASVNRQLKALLEGMGLVMIDLHREIVENNRAGDAVQWLLPMLPQINEIVNSESYAS